MSADKGYDVKANRDAARCRGIVPIIPYRSNRKNPSKVIPKMFYRACARVEQFIGKLTRFRRMTEAVHQGKELHKTRLYFAVLDTSVQSERGSIPPRTVSPSDDENYLG